MRSGLSMCGRVNDASERDGISDVFLRDAAWPSSRRGRERLFFFPRETSLKSILKRVARHVQIMRRKDEKPARIRARTRFPELTIMGTWDG